MREQEKRRRFQLLRRREQEGTITGAEREELGELVHDIEAAEAVLLQPVTERLGEERRAVEAQNSALQALVDRRERLAARLDQVLQEARSERRAIEQELAQILSGDGTASGAAP
jgi:hypothetical protein